MNRCGGITAGGFLKKETMYKDLGEYRDKKITHVLDKEGEWAKARHDAKLSKYDQIIRFNKDIYSVKNRDCENWQVVLTVNILV
jgi:hypothetical protein